jgi:hypothetical protein
MKKKSHSQEIIRIARLKKHMKKNLSISSRNRKRSRIKYEKKLQIICSNVNSVALADAYISNELEAMGSISKTVRYADLQSFSPPQNFDIFSNPEGVLKSINKLRSVLLHPKLRKFNINHKNVTQNSLGSEALLGLLASEIISNRRKDLKEELPVHGKYPKDKTAKEVVKSIGLVCELDGDDFEDASDVTHNSNLHLFRADNRYHENASLKTDKKRKVAEDCVEYLEKCMNAHKLTIKGTAQNRLRACLGEVLDNANEHCGRTKSIWFVRSYFNDVRSADNKGRYLELMVLNLGNSISENFCNLPDDSKMKKVAKVYADRHRKHLSESVLFTVAALQGNVSSKRDLEPNRGQGTVTLIETFESIYTDYCALRDPNGNGSTKAEMNVISGNTVIAFDGSYRSKVVENNDGSETFQMSFNEKKSLQDVPDSKFVYSMDNVFFPGLMINIRIPLQGSTEPLGGSKND